MPDESCRNCGGGLDVHALCSDCRKPTQKKCVICNRTTVLQSHHCQRELLVQPELQVIHKRKLAHRSIPLSLLAMGIAVFFVLGQVIAPEIGAPQGIPTEAQATKSTVVKPIDSFPVQYGRSYDNCLAYGSGESITITCPTDNGYVYKEILNMPLELKKEFSDSVFSIRGVLVMENSDGSVTLQYHLQKYVTHSFGSWG
jgi:hypothetical protein